MMALAVGANATVFTVAEEVLHGSGGVDHPERIVSIHNYLPQMEEALREQPVHPLMVDRMFHMTGVEAAAAFKGGYFNLTGQGEPRRLQGLVTTPQLLDVAGQVPVLGPGFSPDLRGNEHQVLLSFGLWREAFGGDRSVIGRVIDLNREPYEVVGVMGPDFHFPRGADVPASFHFPDRPEVWVPYELPTGGPGDLGLVARLKAGATMEQLDAQLTAVTDGLVADHPAWKGWADLRADRIQDRAVGPVRPAVWLLAAATMLILLASAGNVAGLALTRARQRTRALAVRNAVGGGRAGIVRYLAAETVWLWWLGTLAALGVTAVLTWAIGRWAPAGIPGIAGLGVSWAVVGFAAVTTATMGVCCCLLPGLRISGANLAGALASSTRATTGRGTRRLASMVIAGEVAVTVVLVVSAGLLVRSVLTLLRADLGFDPRQVLTAQITLPEHVYPDVDRMTRVQRALDPPSTEAPVVRFHQAFLAELQALPQVVAAGVVRPLPLGGSQEASVYTIEGAAPVAAADARIAEYTVVGGDYFRAMGIAVLRGRPLTPSDRIDGEQVAVISQSLAALWPAGRDPLGGRIRLGTAQNTNRPWMRVVGIVPDVRRGDLGTPGNPEMYVPMTQGGYTSLATMDLVIRGTTTNPADLAPMVRQVLAGSDQAIPLAAVEPMEALVGRAAVRSRFIERLMAAFAFAGLMISMVGLYAVIANAVAARDRELAVRLALGSPRRSIIATVVGSAAALAAGGLLVGALGAAAAGRVLQASIQDVSTLTAAQMLGGIAVVTACTVIAAVIPALRALRVDPALTLRSE